MKRPTWAGIQVCAAEANGNKANMELGNKIFAEIVNIRAEESPMEAAEEIIISAIQIAAYNTVMEVLKEKGIKVE